MNVWGMSSVALGRSELKQTSNIFYPVFFNKDLDKQTHFKIFICICLDRYILTGQLKFIADKLWQNLFVLFCSSLFHMFTERKPRKINDNRYYICYFASNISYGRFLPRTFNLASTEDVKLFLTRNVKGIDRGL